MTTAKQLYHRLSKLRRMVGRLNGAKVEEQLSIVTSFQGAHPGVARAFYAPNAYNRMENAISMRAYTHDPFMPRVLKLGVLAKALSLPKQQLKWTI